MKFYLRIYVLLSSILILLTGIAIAAPSSFDSLHIKDTLVKKRFTLFLASTSGIIGYDDSPGLCFHSNHHSMPYEFRYYFSNYRFGFGFANIQENSGMLFHPLTGYKNVGSQRDRLYFISYDFNKNQKDNKRLKCNFRLDLGLISSVPYLSPGLSATYKIKKNLFLYSSLMAISSLDILFNNKLKYTELLSANFNFGIKLTGYKSPLNKSDSSNSRKIVPAFEFGTEIFMSGHIIPMRTNDQLEKSGAYFTDDIDTSLKILNSAQIMNRSAAVFGIAFSQGKTSIGMDVSYINRYGLAYPYITDHGYNIEIKNERTTASIFAERIILSSKQRSKEKIQNNFILGGKLRYSLSDVDYKYDSFNGIGGWDITKHFHYSDHSTQVKPMIYAGLERIYDNIAVQLGVTFNTVMYTAGSYSWTYDYVNVWNNTDPPIHRSRNENYMKILNCVSTTYLPVVDNIFIKVRYKFQ